MSDKIDAAIQAYYGDQLPTTHALAVGDTVVVHEKIIEKGKERVQQFKGVVIQIHGTNLGNKTFTVSKVSHNNTRITKVFPLASVHILKVEGISHGKVRQSRIQYILERTGKNARLKKK